MKKKTEQSKHFSSVCVTSKTKTETNGKKNPTILKELLYMETIQYKTKYEDLDKDELFLSFKTLFNYY